MSTFGNRCGGADTEKRILKPEEYSRTWYRQNRSSGDIRCMWSQQQQYNNGPHEEQKSALLTTLLA